MKIKLNTERLDSKILVKGWHISKQIEGPIEELGTDEGCGYLLVTVIGTESTTAFGATWDEETGFTKKLWLSELSLRGLDDIDGVVLFESGTTSIQMLSSLDESGEIGEATFAIILRPDGIGGARIFEHQATRLQGQYISSITKTETAVVSHAMVMRNEYGNPPLLAQELSGYVEFDDATFVIDATNIFPDDPINGEKGWAYIEEDDLPVDTSVLARNFNKFEVSGDTLLQLAGTTLDGRSIDSGSVDTSKPLSLARANTVNIFRNL